jgi:hypothetical protein
MNPKPVYISRTPPKTWQYIVIFNEYYYLLQCDTVESSRETQIFSEEPAASTLRNTLVFIFSVTAATNRKTYFIHRKAQKFYTRVNRGYLWTFLKLNRNELKADILYVEVCTHVFGPSIYRLSPLLLSLWIFIQIFCIDFIWSYESELMDRIFIVHHILQKSYFHVRTSLTLTSSRNFRLKLLRNFVSI